VRVQPLDRGFGDEVVVSAPALFLWTRTQLPSIEGVAWGG
jgi:hypothetical protein